MLRAAAYLVGAIVISALVHAYLHRRLIRDTEIPKRWGRVLFGLASLLPIGMGGLLLMHDLPRSVATPIMGCAFVWVGLLLFLLPFLFFGEIVRAKVDPERRRAIARVIGMASGAATVALGGTAAVVAQLPPLVRRLRISLPKLEGSYTLVQISDLHVSATIGRDLVDSLVRSINALTPDLVAITGDLVDGSVKELGPLVEPLAHLRAKEGVFFVTGNHEYLSGVEEWLAFLPSLGIRVLRNECISLRAFDLVGVDDPSGSSWVEGHGTDLEKALSNRNASRASVLLAHRPDHIHDAAKHGIGLQISGHTHGGQIPIGWVLERAHQPYVFGLHKIEETLLYVTSGAGYWGPPMRLATRAEIVVFELGSA
jgi:predicted MPP superfamily phosphohydrolase